MKTAKIRKVVFVDAAVTAEQTSSLAKSGKYCMINQTQSSLPYNIPCPQQTYKDKVIWGNMFEVLNTVTWIFSVSSKLYVVYLFSEVVPPGRYSL